MHKTIEKMKSFMASKGIAEHEYKNLINELEASQKSGLVWETSEIEKVCIELESKTPTLENIIERNIINKEIDNDHWLIEGDNYHSLVALSSSNHEFVDVIYIDPPYNRGNGDFIYNDNIVDKDDKWKHSKWLDFMEKRLVLSRTLLKEDGLVFISIDDNEQAQLKLLCDEVFGDNNFVSTVIRRINSGGRNSSDHIGIAHEYLHIYAKDKSKLKKFKGELSSTVYPLTDKRGVYKLRSMNRDSSNADPRMNHTIIDPKTKQAVNFDLGWRWGAEKVEWGIESDYIVFKDDGEGSLKVYFKEYRDFDNKGNSINRRKTVDSIFESMLNGQGTKEIKNIFGEKKFDYPKPKKFIKYLLDIVDNKNAVVLDFFAGSGTTGHAVLELNKEDEGKRKFILCTNNENNICEDITYKRLEKVINGYSTPKGEKVEGLPGNLKYYQIELKNK